MRNRSIAILCLAATLLGAGAASADTAADASTLPQNSSQSALASGLITHGQRPTRLGSLDSGLVAAADATAHAVDTQADATVDQLLGVFDGGAEAQGARHIYVDENGNLACVTLDTFFPQPC